MINTSELGYQFPFCQILINEGYRLIHFSKGTAFEQGKDIIAVDKKDVPHIYQLKGGNITLTKWRNIVKAEIEELIDLPIVHPSVKKNKKPVPYLVTNGYLEDTVRVQIDSLNASKWKHNPVQVILLGELLEKFLKWSYEFTPQEIDNYKTFLDLYFANGIDFQDEEKLSNLLKSVLRINDASQPKEERKRNIAAAILFTSYIVSPFKQKENHITIVQTLVLLSSYILAVAEKFQLEDSYWKESFELVWSEIKNALKSLEKEIEDDGLNKLYVSIWDGEIVPYRKHIAVSYLYAYKLSQIIEGDEDWKSIGRDDFYQKIEDSLSIFGESSILAYIYFFEYIFKLTKDNISSTAWLVIPLKALIVYNGRKGTDGLLSPYYKAQTSIIHLLGLEDEDEIREAFTHKSFFIKPLIDLFARYNRKDILEKCWRELTYIEQERFVPEEKWRYFLWRSEQGIYKMEFPKQTQSWKELTDEANETDTNEIPEMILKLPFFLPLFLLVFPHRINTNLIKLLDSSVNRI